MNDEALVFSVTDFVAIFNQTLEVAYPRVRIVGEIANFRVSKGKWVYFDLKDEYSTVKFFGTVYSMPGPVEDGMLIEVAGRPYLHSQFGFSVQVASIAAKGEGSLNKAHMLLIAKLKKEGLFDDGKKRHLPYAPENIAVIASAESAGYGDFKKIISSRWPAAKVELFDVLVQGVDAAPQIIDAIGLANRLSKHEVIVIVRGGGSKDDLAVFDHEQLARAVASSRLPTLVAIGHDRDLSVAEMVADYHASTPSNAAEVLVPDWREELDLINQKAVTISVLSKNITRNIKKDLSIICKQLDEIYVSNVKYASDKLNVSRKLINAYDPIAPLTRGFALVRSIEGSIVRSSFAAKKHSKLSVEFKDGKITVETGKS